MMSAVDKVKTKCFPPSIWHRSAKPVVKNKHGQVLGVKQAPSATNLATTSSQEEHTHLCDRQCFVVLPICSRVLPQCVQRRATSELSLALDTTVRTRGTTMNGVNLETIYRKPRV